MGTHSVPMSGMAPAPTPNYSLVLNNGKVERKLPEEKEDNGLSEQSMGILMNFILPPGLHDLAHVIEATNEAKSENRMQGFRVADTIAAQAEALGVPLDARQALKVGEIGKVKVEEKKDAPTPIFKVDRDRQNSRNSSLKR